LIFSQSSQIIFEIRGSVDPRDRAAIVPSVKKCPRLSPARPTTIINPPLGSASEMSEMWSKPWSALDRWPITRGDPPSVRRMRPLSKLPVRPGPGIALASGGCAGGAPRSTPGSAARPLGASLVHEKGGSEHFAFQGAS
jgi:hypothetical protein